MTTTSFAEVVHQVVSNARMSTPAQCAMSAGTSITSTITQDSYVSTSVSQVHIQ
jgi:hypothetical protein